MTSLWHRTAALVVLLVLANACAKPFGLWISNGDVPPGLIAPACALLGLWVWHREAASAGRACDPRFNVNGLLFACVGLSALPFSQVAWIILALLALLVRKAEGTSSLGLWIVVLAAVRIPLAETAMTFLAEPLLVLDGQIAAGIAQLLGMDVKVQDNLIMTPGGHTVFIMSGCASLANLSDGLLIWACCAFALGQRCAKQLLIGGGLLATTILAINTTRLALMTVSPEMFSLIHDGIGATVVQACLILAIAGTIWLTAPSREAHHA